MRAIEIYLFTTSLNRLKVAFISNRIEINELTDRWLQMNKGDVRETQWIVVLSILLVIICTLCYL